MSDNIEIYDAKIGEPIDKEYGCKEFSNFQEIGTESLEECTMQI
jgi:hypothetical protein